MELWLLVKLLFLGDCLPTTNRWIFVRALRGYWESRSKPSWQIYFAWNLSRPSGWRKSHLVYARLACLGVKSCWVDSPAFQGNTKNPPGRLWAEMGMADAIRRHDLIQTWALQVGHRPGGKFSCDQFDSAMRLPLRAGVVRLAASLARPLAQCLNAAIWPSMSWARGTVLVMAWRMSLGPGSRPSA